MTDLNLGPIGNCSTAALIDQRGRIVWWCLPRFDGDPVFCKLLIGNDVDDARGAFEIALDRHERSEQEYAENTAILVTRLFDDGGGAIEITDFTPRFEQFGRVFRPLMINRIVRRVSGTPRIRVRLRPTSGYGAADPEITHGSNHIRYVGETATIRLTTDAPPSYVLEETPFFLDEPLSFVLGPDEPLTRSPAAATSEFFDRTRDYWRDWIRQQALPLEWQDAVIRAAITIKLCSFEETGAIVAAMTTSIPESADSGRNWDYRYCWLRDAFFVVRALNRLGAVRILENYLRYLSNIIATSDGGHIQPVYGIALEAQLSEREITSLAGYRGMGPVRVGNQAYEQIQHDVYGDIVLASTQAFFDKRLFRKPDRKTSSVSRWLVIAHTSCTTSPMRACGSSAGASGSIPRRASCAGPRATAWQKLPSTSGCAAARPTGRGVPTRFARGLKKTRGAPRPKASPIVLVATASMPVSC